MSKRLLAVLAHPDDESFGPGGTLAKYAAQGVDVHIAIATDGAAGSVAAGYEDRRAELASIRAEELRQAVKILGATLHMLNYRDSGYIGDPANDHPLAFINLAAEEVVPEIVRLIRQVRPQVVLTHDETGGYLHPDHIRCHEVTRAAFFAAGDPTRYPEVGPEPYAPRRLYCTALPDTWPRIWAFLMRLRGQDPTRLGRNKDIDLTEIGVPRSAIHTRIDVRNVYDIKQKASAEHDSQGGGGFGGRWPGWLRRLLFGKEYFIRAYPEPEDGLREKGFFDALDLDEKEKIT